eukprot:TRINITY_DN2041_c0_g2_i2.p1 TRINITY_DN2041_c0_g2~~TRINITY_DN2041_c0_g2_i2.p1  ORF type:complete len:524 (-),score=173.87 TRINITY_DN2041_c0_g2_i2:100-1671(-)
MRISKMLADAKAEYAQYGDQFSQGGKGAQLLHILTTFSTQFNSTIDGISGSSLISQKELNGGARISYIFNEIFATHVASIDPLKDLSPHDLRTIIRNATGPRASLFVPESSFELLVQQQTQKLHKPSLECADLVFDELQRIISQLETKLLVRFPVLQTAVVDVANKLLVTNKAPTVEMITYLIKIEAGYVNTSHPDFAVGASLTSVMQKLTAEQQSQQAQAQGGSATTAGGGSNMLGAGMDTVAQFVQVSADTVAAAVAGSPTAAATAATQTPGAVEADKKKKKRKDLEFDCDLCGSHVIGTEETINAHYSHCFDAKATVDARAAPPKEQLQLSVFQRLFYPRQQEQQQHDVRMATQHHPAAAATAAPVGGAGGVGAGAGAGAAAAAAAAPAPSPPPPPPQMQVSKDGGLTMSMPTTVLPSEPSERERFESELIKALLGSYFGIVKKNVMDTVPKAVMHFLVNATKASLHAELVHALYSADSFDKLLEESPQVAQKRRQAKENLNYLQKAAEILGEIREYTFK